MVELPSSESVRRWTAWVAEANDSLAGLSRLGARWWRYGPPCSGFQLVVGDPAGSNMAIMLFYCRYLAGPTAWQPQSIRITLRSRPDDGREGISFVLEDLPAGFRAESDTLHWARDVDVMDEGQWRLWTPPEADPT